MIEVRLSKADRRAGERSRKLDDAINLPQDVPRRVQDLHEEKKKRWSGGEMVMDEAFKQSPRSPEKKI